jgi:PAP2 superfamily.
MGKRSKYGLAVVLYVLFLALIVLLKTVDVAPIGPENGMVGLSTINEAVSERALRSGVNMEWYKITELLGYFSILAACVFALAGAVQLIRRRSLRKVDRQILALGGMFILAILLYAFFEKAVVNCRPVILPGETGPEASFPSSHTVLVCVILGGVYRIIPDYVKPNFLRGVLRLLALLVIVAMVALRLLCGCHWFTDILGGLLASGAMLALYAAILEPEGET